MAAVIKPGSSRIQFGSYPKVLKPTVDHGKARFKSTSITATGSATFTGLRLENNAVDIRNTTSTFTVNVQ